MKKHTVLVVDDDKTARESLKDVLEMKGYATFIAENGQKGLEIFQKEHPEIALVDIKMPGMNGIEVLKKIREKSKKTEVITITGYGSIDIVIQALKEGAFGYIQKPVLHDELEIEIRKALEKQESQRRLDEYAYTLEKTISEKDEEINARKEAEKRLRLSVQEWERTFNSISDFVFIMDKDFNITNVNKSLCDAFKLKPEDIIDKKCYKIFCGKDAADINCPFEIVLKDKKSHIEEVHFHPVKKPFQITISPIFDDKGEVVAAVHVAKDISELKKINEKLQEKVNELEKLTRITLGRELRMAELKEEVARLKEDLEEKD